MQIANKVDGAFIPKYQGDSSNAEGNLLKGKDMIFPPSQEDILKKGLEIGEQFGEEYMALYFFLYQSGERISESLKLKYGDIREFSQDRHRYVEINSITLKNRTQSFRLIPVPLYIPMEVQMYAYFKQIYDHRINEVWKNVYSRNNVANKFRNFSFNLQVLNFEKKERQVQEVRLHPHLLRHFRLTHLVQIYKYSALQLKQFAGWSSVLPATIYVSLDSSDLADQFRKNYKVK